MISYAEFVLLYKAILSILDTNFHLKTIVVPPFEGLLDSNDFVGYSSLECFPIKCYQQTYRACSIGILVRVPSSEIAVKDSNALHLLLFTMMKIDYWSGGVFWAKIGR